MADRDKERADRGSWVAVTRTGSHPHDASLTSSQSAAGCLMGFCLLGADLAPQRGVITLLAVGESWIPVPVLEMYETLSETRR